MPDPKPAVSAEERIGRAFTSASIGVFSSADYANTRAGLIREFDEHAHAAYRHGWEEAREKAVTFLREWVKHYPPDVFIPPPAGEHSETIGGCTAETLRSMCPRIANAMHRALEPEE